MNWRPLESSTCCCCLKVESQFWLIDLIWIDDGAEFWEFRNIYCIHTSYCILHTHFMVHIAYTFLTDHSSTSVAMHTISLLATRIYSHSAPLRLYRQRSGMIMYIMHTHMHIDMYVSVHCIHSQPHLDFIANDQVIHVCNTRVCVRARACVLMCVHTCIQRCMIAPARVLAIFFWFWLFLAGNRSHEGRVVGCRETGGRGHAKVFEYSAECCYGYRAHHWGEVCPYIYLCIFFLKVATYKFEGRWISCLYFFFQNICLHCAHSNTKLHFFFLCHRSV